MTESRLESVISKIGQVTKDDTGTLISAYTKDTMEEFLKDFSEKFQVLKSEHQKVLTKKLSTVAIGIVKKYFIEIKKLENL